MSKRYAFVGLGHRAQMYVDALLGDWRDTGTIVALLRHQPDPDELLRRAHRRRGAVLRPRRVRQGAGAGRRRGGHARWTPPTPAMSSPPWTRGLDVIVEKPLTIDAEGCQAIADAAERDPGELVVTFNYRYSPRNSAVKRADQRRRDRRRHLGALRVAARHRPRRRLLPPLAPRQGQLRRPAGAQVHPPLRPGQLVARRRARARLRPAAGCGSTATATPRPRAARPAASRAPRLGSDPFRLDIAADPRLKRLYLDAEHARRLPSATRTSSTPASPSRTTLSVLIVATPAARR